MPKGRLSHQAESNAVFRRGSGNTEGGHHDLKAMSLHCDHICYFRSGTCQTPAP